MGLRFADVNSEWSVNSQTLGLSMKLPKDRILYLTMAIWWGLISFLLLGCDSAPISNHCPPVWFDACFNGDYRYSTESRCFLQNASGIAEDSAMVDGCWTEYNNGGIGDPTVIVECVTKCE